MRQASICAGICAFSSSELGNDYPISPLPLGAGRCASRSINLIRGLLYMSSILIAVLVFGCTFGGAMMGIFLRARLPEHHRDDGSKEVLKLVIGLIATVAALVLSLLISSAKTTYDTQEGGFRHLHRHQLAKHHHYLGNRRRRIKYLVGNQQSHWQPLPQLGQLHHH